MSGNLNEVAVFCSKWKCGEMGVSFLSSVHKKEVGMNPGAVGVRSSAGSLRGRVALEKGKW